MRRLGKYQLLEQIASDSKANTYRAQLEGRAGFQKTVIVKCLSGSAKRNSDVVRRFVDEARVAALIQHRNVVQVIELGRSRENDFFVVMEFMDGCDLREMLRASLVNGERVPPWLSVHIACEVLDGLAHAHELVDPRRKRRSLIHRNVTPDNIFVSRLGEVKLGDFGAIRSANSLPPGRVEGKVTYLAPEMIQGYAVDHRADIFAVGVVLWECLTQRRLFKRTRVAESLKHICAPQRPMPSSIAPDIPSELDAVTLRALSLLPRDRYVDARAMHERLLDIREDLVPNLRPDQVREALEIFMRRPQAANEEEGVEITEAPIVAPMISVGSFEPTPEASSSWSDAQSIDSVWATPPDEPSEAALPKKQTASPQAPADAPPRLPPEQRPIPNRRAQPAIELHLAPNRQRAGTQVGHQIGVRGLLLSKGVGSHDAAARPFWIDSVSEQCGPLSLGELMARLHKEPSMRRSEVRISCDRHGWLSAPRFLELAGLDFDWSPALSDAPPGIALAEGGLTRILVRLVREGATGRLLITNQSATRSFRELHLLQGMPTYVVAAEPELQPPLLLVEHKILAEADVVESMADVISLYHPLARGIAERGNLEVDHYRAFVMTLRLEAAFGWRHVEAAFHSGPEIRCRRPFATSMIRLLPFLVGRSRDARSLRRHVDSRLDRPVTGSQDAEWALSKMNIAEADRAWLAKCRDFATARDWLASASAPEHRALVLAKLLLDLSAAPGR